MDAFEVLRTRDQTTWSSIAAEPPRSTRGIVSYPASIAGAESGAYFVLAGRNRAGESWRGGWRIPRP